MSQVKGLKKKRTSLKSQLTRFNTFVDKFDVNTSDELAYLELESRLDKVRAIYTEFDEVEAELENLLDSGSQDNDRESFENIYHQASAKARSFLIKAAPAPVLPPITDTTINTSAKIKLPTLNLPSFSGAFDEWSHFHDSFLGMIHNNTSLTNTQKFYYLSKSLQRDALNVIEAIAITDDNYPIAWDLLKDRFGNKRIIINSHIKAIFSIPSLTKESSSGLRQLTDNIVKHVRALACLGQPTDQWDTILIHIISGKLDPTTLRDWQASITDLGDNLPTLADLKRFLITRCEMLETLGGNNNAKPVSKSNYSRNSQSFAVFEAKKCNFCRGDHSIQVCNEFLKLDVNARFIHVKTQKWCLNCLYPGHTTSHCKGGTCRKCHKRHNTLLHFENGVLPATLSQTDANKQANPTQQINANAQAVSLVAHHSKPNVSITSRSFQSKMTLLPTAVVQVHDCVGKTHSARVLLDSASQSNFITCKLLKKLGLQSQPLQMSVIGINNSLSTIDKRVQIKFESNSGNYKTRISCLVIPHIAHSIPPHTCESTNLNIPTDLRLADPEFNERSEIDILVGAELFWQLICQGQVRLGHNLPILQKTLLGWVVSGPAMSTNISLTQNYLIQHDLSNIELDNNLTKFWMLEEVLPQSDNGLDNNPCEQYFKETFTKTENGRFIVKLPFINNFSIGQSYDIALQRYYWLEKRLNKDPNLKTEYSQFINEYKQLNHMSQVTGNVDITSGYYLPHHAVLKDSSTTTKLRVVFDASAKSSNNRSLNDNLLVGPIVQSELFSILLRFRKHRFVVTADIAKMYRQILVSPEHRKFQRILWRNNTELPIETYELNTVTYGTGAAPYLATRCIMQLALENKDQYPNASRALSEDFYVDDFISGDEHESKLIELNNLINRILLSAGMQLRKWASNSQLVLNSLEETEHNIDLHSFTSDEETKTLGLFWNTKLDSLCYVIPKINLNTITKRSILSAVSRIFDPLGLVAPIIITIKVLIQSLWSLKVSWDEALPLHIYSTWSKLQEDLSILNSLKICRHVLTPNFISVEIHGFSDASQIAYGACVYLKSRDNTGMAHAALLCAKSRVAPLKTLTIPRLELCAASLLSKLIQRVIDNLQIKYDSIYYWTDSQIVLAWIKGCPSKWKVYVANRVTDIQNITDKGNWHYVNTAENPADLISRGIKPSKLLTNHLWWNGPDWLRSDSYPVNATVNSYTNTDIPEQRSAVATAITAFVAEPILIFANYSSWSKLKRIFALVTRFINNCNKLKTKRVGNLTKIELSESEHCIIHLLQRESFSDIIPQLQGSGLRKNNRLLALSPFLDASGIVRVGGRLRNSSFTFDKRHPILLPNKHHVTKLIITYEHTRLLHAGPTAVLASLRERYWPINGRNMTRQVIRSCYKCFRANPTLTYIPTMGELPIGRVRPARPFQICGVDYAGPFLIKDRKLRGSKLIKSYLCLFVCFTTKAVHLELVTDLSTNVFLAALHRFIARRGKPTEIYSDNGTNFVGAQKEIGNFLLAQSKEIDIHLANEAISWKHIPPRAPHFGGLWEAAVKTFKHHLKRVVTDASLTYEEFCTIIIQIEACMNSRPILPLSTDPSDLNPLTPAHFLIGAAITAVPEPTYTDTKEHLLSRYQRSQKMFQTFWKRWSKDYMAELQTRSKWKSSKGNCPTIGDLVLLMDDNLPPMRWRMGRISELHKGKDNIARVASVSTSSGIIRRAFSKLCPLPRLDTDN